ALADVIRFLSRVHTRGSRRTLPGLTRESESAESPLPAAPAAPAGVARECQPPRDLAGFHLHPAPARDVLQMPHPASPPFSPAQSDAGTYARGPSGSHRDDGSPSSAS